MLGPEVGPTAGVQPDGPRQGAASRPTCFARARLQFRGGRPSRTWASARAGGLRSPQPGRVRAGLEVTVVVQPGKCGQVRGDQR